MAQQELTAEEKEIRTRLATTGQLVTIGGQIILALIKYGCYVLIAKYLAEGVIAFAGHDTSISTSFITRLTANTPFVTMISILFGFGGTGYGLAQRRLRRRTIGHISGRKEELEKRIDPGRHSSSLTKNGTTRPEDL